MSNRLRGFSRSFVLLTNSIIAISDVIEGRGSVWYDLTGQLDFVPRD